jgi:CheY-like chemotaxis protein
MTCSPLALMTRTAQRLLLRSGYTECGMSKKTRILAVDDEPIIGELLVGGLDAPHRTVMVAGNGRDALAMATKQSFDLVITDHRMPQFGGLEFVRKLRRRRFHGKIIVLSGHLSPDNIGIYEQLGIDKVISKPCDMAELRQIVESLEETTV